MTRRLLPLVLLLLATRVSASEPERPSRADLQRALAQYEQSVVRVRGPRETGLGIIVGTEGQVLTSVRHVSLDAAQVELNRLTMSLTDTLKLYNPQGMGGGIPTDGGAIPGSSSTIPGQHAVSGAQLTAAPAEGEKPRP